MLTTIVIRSKDEADRLRLALASLAGQAALGEVVVVDDGSSDRTPQVIAEAASSLPLRVVSHRVARGRSAAANAGARAARGDVLVFLDGDTLAGPGLVARHAALHAARPDCVGRGETFHLRCTRFLLDPECATPRPGEEERLARLASEERERLKVTLAQVRHDFTSIERRATPGIYPGSAPRLLCELEMEALREHPDCSVLWAAASGCNWSVRRSDFLGAGGFDEMLDINEHRELALRLCQRGAKMAAVDGACSYHLTHRSGWRDPLQDTRWESAFYAAHPRPVVKLLAVFWASLSPDYAIPADARITSLPALEEAASRYGSGIDYDAIRRSVLSLPELATSAVDKIADGSRARPSAPSIATTNSA